MATVSTAFDVPGLVSEHISIQRKIASLFPGTEVRRRYQEGAFTERPFILISFLSSAAEPHSNYVAYPVAEYNIAYYGSSFEDAQQAADKLQALNVNGGNRIDLWDYSDMKNPVETDYKLRVQQASCTFIADLDDDTLYNTMCSLSVETKRSLSDYEGVVMQEIPVDEDGIPLPQPWPPIDSDTGLPEVPIDPDTGEQGPVPPFTIRNDYRYLVGDPNG